MIASIIVMIIEVLFMSIPLLKIKDINFLKDKIKLFVLIFLSNIISTLFFNSLIFRYILYAILIFLSLKIVSKCIKFSDLFIIVIQMIIKTFLDFIIYFMFFNNLEYFYFLLILEIFTILSIHPTKNFIFNIYNNTFTMWNGNLKFYFRYLLLVLSNTLIIFLIYNLLKIKEVF